MHFCLKTFSWFALPTRGVTLAAMLILDNTLWVQILIEIALSTCFQKWKTCKNFLYSQKCFYKIIKKLLYVPSYIPFHVKLILMILTISKIRNILKSNH